MDEQTLLREFELLADAPNAIPRLREMILQLAIRGGLATQNSSDEPADDAVDLAAEDIQDLYLRGKITKPPRLPKPRGDEAALPVPSRWTWVRLGQVLALVNGRAYKKSELLKSGTPVIRIQNLNGSGAWYFSDLELPEEKYCHAGDLLYSWSGTFGPYLWNGDKAIFHYHIWRIELTRALEKEYAYLLLKAISSDVKGAAHGIMLLHMTKGGMERQAVPLPPLPEQRRIVAKVDELMRLCDELESRQEKRKSVRVSLNTSALDALQKADREDLPGRWQFIRDHFDLLYQDPQNVQKLKETILQLAVQGKLTRQDPKDEPASELLKRIEAEKQRLYEEGKIRKPKKLPPVKDEEKPFELPTGWEWTPMSDIMVEWSTGLERRKAEQGEDRAIHYFKMNNIGAYGECLTTGMTKIDASEDEIETYRLQDADFLFNTRNSFALVGKTCVFDHPISGAPVLYNNNILRVRFGTGIHTCFVNWWFVSPGGKAILDTYKSNTTNVAAIYQKDLMRFPIALPPVAEQRRIVAKVDELMRLCDELEERLTQSEAKAERLLEAVVRGAVLP